MRLMFHHMATIDRDGFLAAVLPMRTIDAWGHIVLCKDLSERRLLPGTGVRNRSSCELPLPFRRPWEPGTKATSGSYSGEGPIKAMEKLQ